MHPLYRYLEGSKHWIVCSDAIETNHVRKSPKITPESCHHMWQSCHRQSFQPGRSTFPQALALGQNRRMCLHCRCQGPWLQFPWSSASLQTPSGTCLQCWIRSNSGIQYTHFIKKCDPTFTAEFRRILLESLPKGGERFARIFDVKN